MKDPTPRWFAFRTLWNSQSNFIERMREEGIQTWVPERLVDDPEPSSDGEVKQHTELVFPSLVFIKTDSSRAKSIQCDSSYKSFPYRTPGTPDPAPIPDKQMEQFMWVTKVGCRVIQPVDCNLVKGDHVRITGGLFEGAEGYICRVKGTKRFIVKIDGVSAIATSYIPRCYIEKLTS